MSYVELRVKTNFSFLTGASHPNELVQQAISLNLAGIALTDINGVYGMPRGYRVAREHTGFKYLCGTEFTFYDHAPMTVIAKNRLAYAKICQLITRSKEGQEKGEGRLSIQTFLQDIAESLASHFVLIPRIESDLPIWWSELKHRFKKKYLFAVNVLSRWSR